MNKQDELAALSNLTADRTNKDQILGGIIAKAAALVAADAQTGQEYVGEPSKFRRSKLLGRTKIQNSNDFETLTP